MYYLRIDDLRVALLCGDAANPVVVERNHIPGAFAEVLAELSSAVSAERLDVLVSGPTTIAPVELLTGAPGETEQIFGSCFNFVDNDTRRVFSNDIPALHSRLLFGVKSSVYEAIVQQFSTTEVRFVSALTPLLRHFSEHYDGGTRFRVYLNCRDRFVDVLAFDGRQLAVLNSFPVSKVNDAVYYTLAFSKTVGLDIADTPYIVVGNTVMVASVVSHLRRFANNVTSPSLLEEFGASSLTLDSDIPYDLAVHILCES